MASKRTPSERLRRRLVRDLSAKEVIASDPVRDAFLTVPREQFIPEVATQRGLEAVYRNEAIATKRGPHGMPISSSSQPAIMAKMLELLDVQLGDRVLEIGTGTGYNAALLAHLAGPCGKVTSVDIDADLARRARRALRDAGARVSVVAGDGRHGHPPRAPFSRIIATASADAIPRAWLRQLSERGRLVMPLRLDPERDAIQLIPVFERHGAKLESVGLTWGGFMPLHSGDGGWRPPPATLSAVHSIDDRHTGLVSLTGHGIGQLSAASARRLLISILSESGKPRRRGLTDLGWHRPPLLLLYLQLNIPAERRLSLTQPGRWGIGIVDRSSQSAAIVSLRSPWSTGGNQPGRRARWRLDAYGSQTAAAQLDRLLDRWRELEHAGHTKLLITAQGRATALRLSFSWTHP